MFKLPVGFPVIVSAQIKDDFKIFCGLALRPEDGYNLGSVYKGKISIVRVMGGWGQNEQLEIIHNISHVDGSSLTCWSYFDEINEMCKNFSRDEQRAQVVELARWLTIRAPDLGQAVAKDDNVDVAPSG